VDSFGDDDSGVFDMDCLDICDIYVLGVYVCIYDSGIFVVDLDVGGFAEERF